MDMSEHVHDHSAHAGGASPAMAMAMDMGHMSHSSVVGRRADGSYYYTHGAYLGHMVPGTFFILWGTWWLVATYWTYLRAAAARRPFSARAWHPVWFGPAWLRRFPLEPAVKVALPFCGILGELWLGHESWRTLVGPDGKYVMDNLNDWQHSAMYGAFITSGAVDLVGVVAGLPGGVERAFLGMGFLIQGLLLGFHLKGPPIEVMVHLILVLIVGATVAATAAEGYAPGSLVVASLRPALTLLQGVWWVQTAYVLYRALPRFDPDDMQGSMMMPPHLVVHMMWVALFCVALLITMRAIQTRMLGRAVEFTPLRTSDGGGDEEGGDRTLELSAFSLPK